LNVQQSGGRTSARPLRDRRAIDDFYTDKQRYPESLDALVRDHYLRTLPADPLTGSSDKWIQVRSSDSAGLIDVRSAASGTGCDGTEYRSW
jgi:general secretion pathway protein G